MGTQDDECSPQRRRRDPEGRRRAIIEAAAELLIELGSRQITHRLVAARAGVPLGSTTQYFATLDDLRTAAVDEVAAEVDGFIVDVRETLSDGGMAPAALAAGLAEFLADDHLVRASSMVMAMATTDDHAKALAQRWRDGLVPVLAPTIGADSAIAVAMFLDGATWASAAGQTPLDVAALTDVLTRLFGAASPTS
jgi:DNA-binding transcriptional regulator YbjK